MTKSSPERIIITPDHNFVHPWHNGSIGDGDPLEDGENSSVEYIRADLVDPWNHNMDEAPRDGREFLAFDKNATPQIYVCWRESFDNDYGGYLTDHYDSDNSPTAWKHITPPE